MKIVFIGGVGGSGTRVVANILKSNGIFIGDNLNVSLDNLDWPGQQAVIKDKSLSFSQKVEGLRIPFQNFIDQMINAQKAGAHTDQSVLAIKVPGSFFYLPYLCKIFDDICYIHTIRHGLDMAFSSNKNQLKNWGVEFGVLPGDSEEEKCQFKYWVKANEYAIDIGNKLLNDNFYLLKFEKLCDNSESEVKRLFEFLQLDNNIPPSLLMTIKRPVTFQRYRNQDLTVFTENDLMSLNKLGYEV
ncbi:hypothetical protein A9R00_02040 [Oleispira antarctica]|uniref:Sulfotransferase domain-containing protein n=1 Tax=Oleispira antarctica TaxID=188908 RepID=A0A1Y5HV93_OLEAN|nr:hypothetical protein A9R00_02040 [Oleispira antarctica]